MVNASFSSDMFPEAVRFMRRKHRGEKQLNGISTSRHVMNVARSIARVLERTREGTMAQRRAIVLAALGHDLLEGTDATQQEVREIFGDKAFRIIWGMTDEWDKRKPKKYAEKVGRSNEAVRLLKLADHVDNYGKAVRRFPRLGRQRIKRDILPILEPMRHALLHCRFRTYKRSSEIFKAEIEALGEKLNNAMALRSALRR